MSPLYINKYSHINIIIENASHYQHFFDKFTQSKYDNQDNFGKGDHHVLRKN